VVFELNGSLHVESLERDGVPLTNFVQDAVGVGALGPSVRVDLGAVAPAGQSVTLRFRWSGALASPEGGPLATKRLAYVGTEGSYLMYAARWFPFHDYAVDRATSDITIIVPTGMQVAGTSDEPVAAQPQTKDGTSRYRFVRHQPTLPGNFAAGQYITRTLRFGGFEIQFDFVEHVLDIRTTRGTGVRLPLCAQSVADYLSRLGTDPARLQVVPKGETQPSGLGDEKDRRVELTWH
jgi:hypothetical protein